ncbi:MAG: DUF547 domain-containing protein [Acidobacteriota bacterium]
MGLFMLLVVSLLNGVPNPQEPFRHDLWDQVLRKSVNERGLVDYRELKADPAALFAYVESIARYSPDNVPELFPSRAHRLAYWINAYNALTVNRVVRNYPLKSFKDLGGFLSSVFDKKQIVGGKSLSYNDIEHKIIRRRFAEPRIHFVLNCASRSCAPLRAEALTAENLEASLQEAARNFFRDSRNIRIDGSRGKVVLSRYFDWFKDDFLDWLRKEKHLDHPRVLDYVRLYLGPEKQQLLKSRERWRVSFFDYDWSLNDAASATGTRSGGEAGLRAER